MERALVQRADLPLNARLLAVELLAAFLPLHQAWLRGALTAGRLLETLLEWLPPERSPAVPTVLRCGRIVETGFRVAVLRLLSAGMGLQTSWFAGILARRGLLRFVYALSTPAVLRRDSLLAASLRNLFQWALLNRHVEVLFDAAKHIPALGIQEIAPFSDILQFVREHPAAEEAEKVPIFGGGQK